MDYDRRYLNNLKGLLIVLVVIGHFAQTIANNLPNNFSFLVQGIVLFIYSFHMPLFLFVSGFLSKNTEKRRMLALKDLMIPYLVFQLFCGVCFLLTTKSADTLLNIFTPVLGAWYLLSLFSYRILLPELTKVRGVIVIGILLTIFTCYFSWADSFLALRKTLGFFVYFYAGYLIKDVVINKSPIIRWLSRLGIIVSLAIFIIIAYLKDSYKVLLSIFTRGYGIADCSHWYDVAIVYTIAFSFTSVMILLVLCSLPDSNRILEKQGVDTMPMYLSHLFVFLVISFCVDRTNRFVAIILPAVGCCFSIVVFSQKWYRNFFNRILMITKSLVCRE